MKFNFKIAPAVGTLAGLFLCLGAISPVHAQGGPGAGWLKTKVSPGRAGVFIDGKYIGPAANFRIGRKFAVAEGEHEVRLVDPRYEELTRKVTIKAGETTTLTERLKPIPVAVPPFGRLRTDGFSKFSAVFVNGKFYGHTDEFNNFAQALLLNPGEYKIHIVPLKEGEGAVHEETVKIVADQVTIVKAK